MCTEREGLNATAIKAPFPLLTPNTSAPRGCLSSPPAAPNSPTAQPLGVNPPSWAEARTVRGQVRLERAKWGWRGGGGGCAHPRASLRCAPAAAGGSRFSRAPGGARLGPGPLPPPLVPAAAFCRSSRRGSPSPRDGRPARRAASPRLAAAGGIKCLLSAVRLGGSAPPPRARGVGGEVNELP